MKNIKAYWSFSLDTECPKCNIDINLDDCEGFSYVFDLELDVLEHDTDKSKNINVCCPKCGSEFIVDLDY